MTETSTTTALPTTVVSTKGDTSVTDCDATETSDFSLDVMPPSGTPFSKMFSCCLPKASEADDDEVDEKHDASDELTDDEATGIEVSADSEIEVSAEASGLEFEEEVDAPVVEKTRELELEDDEEPVAEAPTYFTMGKAAMSFAVVGATVGAVVANGLA